MYVPRPFTEHDRDTLVAHIRARAFATLIAGGEIAHLPLVIDDGGTTLRGHVARGNPIVERLRRGEPMTAVFLGPDAYVSPRWYATPTEQVPTWNYVAVHAHGRGRALDRAETRAALEDLVAIHEPDAEWRLERLDPAFVASLLEGIVGFAVDVERLEGKAKLSQNRSEEDRARVVAALRARGRDDDRRMAELMSMGAPGAGATRRP
ncbi:MAG: FMN-binding negative transcriptional regulator [Deltaproteobacteria bacterium]|nr:FMN-binding negative transcriptional regulator [Deltaproteobacteria bacterium]